MTPSVERAILAAATIETVSCARFLRNKNNRRTNQTWREFITMEVSPSRNRHHEPDPNSPSISTPFARAELPAVTISRDNRPCVRHRRVSRGGTRFDL